MMMMNSSQALKALRAASQQRCISTGARRAFRRRLLAEEQCADGATSETWGAAAVALVMAVSASSALPSLLEQTTASPQHLEKCSSPAKRGLLSPAVLCFPHAQDSTHEDTHDLPHSPGPLSMHHKYDIDFTCCIGQGAYSQVFRATDKRTGQAMALKRIARSAYDAQAFQRETGALERIHALGGHAGILGLANVYSDDHYYFLVLPLAEGGELYEDLVANGSYSEAEAAALMQTLAGALSFLHNEAGLCHADLKPENILLQTKGDRSKGNVQLIDFGCATAVEDGTAQQRKTASGGTSAYYSPERFETSCATPEADMWSVGVLLFILLCDAHPFDRQGIATDEEMQHTIRQCREVDIPDHVSPGARSVLCRLLAVDPRQRMTAQEMMDHPWVKQELQQHPEMRQPSPIKTNTRATDLVVASSMLA